LIVDDERTNVNALGSILFTEYEVHVALSGEQTFKYLNNCERLPEMILLDVVMPEMDGYQVCRELKNNERFQEIVVIFVSALNGPLDKVKGLKLGAVDFISKPFNNEEVLTRVETHLAIVEKQNQLIKQHSALVKLSEPKLKNMDFFLDIDTFKIHYKAATIELTCLEFNLFNLLYQKPEQIFSRGQIIDLAYPDMREISDRTIDAHVKNIRNKIKSLGLEDTVVESVYGAGYRYLVPK